MIRLETWRERLDSLLDGKTKLFEEDYKIKYPCKYKINGEKVQAQICFETGEIFVKGEVVRRFKATN
ncbi:hypothetical protein [Hathewaya massiliensis]|uniref:hypothetical protein n=1 Tax=Hathewaya massiliensis TaxID=1964382 RepID=UPI001FAA3939|nr:hypothetical protein [Hathewaya massiliensis]